MALKKKIIVYRKGATRDLSPGKEEIPEKYRSVGQPVFLGGSFGTSSYILEKMLIIVEQKHIVLFF